MRINFIKLTETAIAPFRGSDSAAGYDLFLDSNTDVVIEPHETVKVHTGLAMEIPEGYFGGVFARSGLSTKEGLRPANCVGVIDSDYRGEIMIPLHNDSKSVRRVEPGTKIAQMIIMPYLQVEYVEVDELSETERGTNGFGSTGK